MPGFGGVITAARERANSLTVGSAMAVVSFCSGFISYTHISALTQHVGQSWKTAHLMPFCVDGQIVIGSAYFMYGKSWKSKTAGLVFGVVPGIAESLIANWESGIVHGLFAAGWATVPAQAFACSTILFERWLHARRDAVPARPSAVPVLAAAPLAMARIAAELFPQAPEPVAPEVQEAVPVPVHLHAAPQGAPWGLVSPAAAPVLPAARPVPVLGPVMSLADRPAPKPRAVKAVPDAPAEPLPSDPAELARVVGELGQNELARRYGISRYKAGQLKSALKDGTLEQVA